jgi:hypothetical protein
MRFRKKPVIIEAVKWNPDKNGNFDGEWPISWLGSADKWKVSAIDLSLFIPTLEGEMKASSGDWIIKGVNGEFYPCKPDIFEKTYEAVKEDCHEQTRG